MRDSKSSKRKETTDLRATGALVISSVARRRIAALMVGGLILIIIGVIVLTQKKDSSKTSTSEPQTGMMQVGQYYEKQKQCYSDNDCPDNTYCTPAGVCSSTDSLPLRQSQPILGRGRAGEGTIFRVSSRTQGQN